MAVRNRNALEKVRYFIIRDGEGKVWRFERSATWRSRMETDRSNLSYNPHFPFRYMPLPDYDKENLIEVETIKANALNTIQFIDFNSTPVNSITVKSAPYFRAIRTNKAVNTIRFPFGIPSWITTGNSPMFTVNYNMNTEVVYTPTLPTGS